jgi:hypothetical protein
MKAAAEYERLALECLQMAAQMKDPEQKATMLHLANTWQKLALTRSKTKNQPPDSSGCR